jgi:hypothetical protein
MIENLEWQIWYEDGSTFSNDDGLPEESPPWGAVAIGQRARRHYQDALYSGAPWYVYRTDHGFWMELDDTGYLDCMVHHAKDVSAVRPGRYIRRDHFFATMKQVEAWIYSLECHG